MYSTLSPFNSSLLLIVFVLVVPRLDLKEILKKKAPRKEPQTPKKKTTLLSSGGKPSFIDNTLGKLFAVRQGTMLINFSQLGNGYEGTEEKIGKYRQYAVIEFKR